MGYKKYELPRYPVTEDMWDRIAADPRPIAVYGMGNGADKLFDRLEKYGVSVSDVFASDGFVRGHSYRGYKVRSLSDVIAERTEVLILVSFASHRPEVVEMISALNDKYSVLIPDMPVAGQEYFDKDFYNSNYETICAVYSMLADEDSKNAYAAIINYKLYGKFEYLEGCFSEVSEIYDLLPADISVSVDAGAYNGDTVRELFSYRPQVKRTYAIEPDTRNFKKLSGFVEKENLGRSVIPINAAVWNFDGSGGFSGSGNRNSSVSSTVSYESRAENTALVRIDTVVKESVDYIKYDVEGAEEEAIFGSDALITTSKPGLLISAYHRSRDIFYLPELVKRLYPFYSLYIRRTMCFPAWEIALIAIDN